MPPTYATQAAITLSLLDSSALFWGCWKYFHPVVTYEAPFESTKDPEREVPGQYVVRLKPGYSMEQHSATTGYDIKRHVSMSGKLVVLPDRTFYSTIKIGPEMLAAIRADRSVISIAPAYALDLSPNWEGWVSTSEDNPFEVFDEEYSPSSVRWPAEYDPASPPPPPPLA
ncbi:hypothetical protein EJ08DRAFT_516261 [Tothia fuscella]|uniref:Uncharacterized protein n=1 Tax=Tothia fuscella TaxID=1048955 RepID=A0A9P4TTW9_9PEZI|nr:hypothetical protein EJ08DRAFT_516261 [Tothia fuscella]